MSSPRRGTRERLEADLISLASHQLRTPLSGIKWLIETLTQGRLGPLTPKQRAYLVRIHQITERMIRLVFEMLNVLRLESDTLRMRRERIAVGGFLADLIADVATEAKNRRIRIVAPADGQHLRVEADAEILRTILHCFLTNAVDYSPLSGEVRVSVRVERGGTVFAVRDKGIGIPKSEQGRIFDRFYRGSNAKAAKPDGTGLGLYIAATLAARIGGRVWFESDEGKGSTFFLRVPHHFRGR